MEEGEKEGADGGWVITLGRGREGIIINSPSNSDAADFFLSRARLESMSKKISLFSLLFNIRPRGLAVFCLRYWKLNSTGNSLAQGGTRSGESNI